MAQDFLLELVQNKLDSFCDQKRDELSGISEDLIPLIDFTQSLLSGGKRFRALFCYWSFASTLGSETNSDELNADSPIVGVAAALEMFHAAALVHDDLLDQSDTRRGAPSIHKRFERKIGSELPTRIRQNALRGNGWAISRCFRRKCCTD